MIIKIEGLPEGRTVKHINVDITFDETGPVVKSTVDTTAPTKLDARQDTPQAPSTEPVQNIAVDRPVVDEPRERKEIPPEMSDMEF